MIPLAFEFNISTLYFFILQKNANVTRIYLTIENKHFMVIRENYKLFFRHSGLYGFKVFKIMSNEKYSYESVDALKPSNAISIIEIPLQSTTDSQIEVRIMA